MKIYRYFNKRMVLPIRPKGQFGDGFQYYSIIFPEKKTGIVIMSNSDNAESIVKELLEISIGDIYTPWNWENYIPYDMDVFNH